MNHQSISRLTLALAAIAGVSIPLISQFLGANDLGRNKGAGQVSGQPLVVSSAAIEKSNPPLPIAVAAIVRPATAPAVVRLALTPPPLPAATALAAAPPATAPAAAASAPAVNPVAAPLASRVEAPATPATAPAAPLARPASEPAVVIRDAAGHPVDPDKVVISVGDVKITAGDVASFVDSLPLDQRTAAMGAGRRRLADYLAKTELLADAARQRKLDQDPKVQRQLAMDRDRVLAGIMADDINTNIADAEIRQFFEEHKHELERVQVRHVLVRTPDSRVPPRPGQQALTEPQAKAKADDIYARLKAGADFVRTAREESDDVGSAQDGGDLGSFSHGRWGQADAFDQAAFSLKPGEISRPVRSQFGWHIIQVMERFDTPEKMAEQIREIIGPRKMTQMLGDLEQAQKPSIDDAFFGPAPVVMPGTGSSRPPR